MTTMAKRRARRPQDAEPEDARRGLIAPVPADAREARADRELADAERDRVQGTAAADQLRRLAAVDGVRTPEERRRRWLGDPH